MPRTLMIMRHGKSSWRDDSLADIDRPLKARGKCDARRMGTALRARGLAPQLVLCSPARRARATAKRVCRACDCGAPLNIVPALYPGDSWEIWHALAALPDDLRTVLVVGHNPGLEDLVSALTGQVVPLPTAALAVIEVPADRWADLGGLADPVPGRLRLFLNPRDLPPLENDCPPDPVG
jgi:phosphohistidine phosphatase